MNKGIVSVISIAFLLLPGIVYPQSEQTGPNIPPPVSQELVPEGSFALKLAPALQLGTPESEIQAVDTLASVGITPKNGWIADYPVTPDIIGELQDAVVAAADSKKLPMEKEEALKAFQDVAAEFNLGVLPGDSGTYVENQPQPNPAVINNYYYEEGPPVVTYYPPPPDYGYLYGWVPYPFWHSGFFFGGFFVLHDFHRTVVVGHRRCVVSNHFFDHKTRKAFTIDPTRRRTGEAFKIRDASRNRGFNTPEARKGAESIFQRSHERAARMTTGKGFDGSNFGRPNARGRSEEQRFTNKGNNNHTFDRRSDRSVSPVSKPNSFERRNEMDSRASSPREGRSFRSSSVTSGRSSNQPSAESRSFRSSEGLGRSFSAPNRSFSAPSRGSSSTCANCHGGNSSFGRSGGGSSPRASSGGGFSRGGGFSGGRGGGGRGR